MNGAGATPAASLAAAWGDFREQPAVRHLAGVLLVAGLLAGRFGAAVFAPEAVQDEEVYAAAFARVTAGASPYEGLPFFYLPPFATAGAWLAGALGLPATLGLLRGANLLAMAAIAWLASGAFRLSFGRRVALCALFGALSPAAHLALAWGNLSPLSIAFWLAAFLLWRRRPLLAGAAYALAILVKPIAAIGIGLLALHRPAQPRDGKLPAQWVAAGAAAVLLAAAVLPSPWLGDFFQLSRGVPDAGRSASLHHLLHCFGIELAAIWLLPLVTVGALAYFWRRPQDERGIYAVAAIAGLLATPVVWSHTLLLVLPLEAAALAIAWQRYRASRRTAELLAVATAVLAIQMSNGLGGVEKWPLWVQGLLVALPCFAPLGLALYLRARLRADTPMPGRPGRP